MREVLLVAEVPSLTYPFYFVFARRIDRLSQTVSGESLLLEVRAYLALWVARGLIEAVLKAICVQALNLSV